VVLLREGQVAYDGLPEDALTAAHLSRTFGADLTVERAGVYYQVRVAESRRGGSDPAADRE